ncbi:hypothetical protein [Saccharicrinis sp. GN24d3]|uniref:hypothetical protein n=1 Tax=Saccharicrinis sp. GN24d3 TaxID=3458416 RepID=UPI00403564CB
MKKPALFLPIFLIGLVTYSQQLMQLHPIAGDTIDQTEKRLFYLFPEIPDSSYLQGVIFGDADKVTLSVSKISGEVYVSQLDSLSIADYQQNIEKLLVYYSLLDEKENEDLAINNDSIGLSPTIEITAEMRRQIGKDARRYLRKKDRAEDYGLWGKDKEDFIKGAANVNFFKARIRMGSNK